MLPRATAQQLARLKAYKPHFAKVQAATGVPWEAIAAIWYRESFSVTPPKTPGGPFQFDPAPSDNHALSLLDRYTNLSQEAKADIIAKGVNDFEAAAYLAACHMRARCTPKITPESPDADIKDLFWGYNGKAKYQKTADGSFYVMNGFDEKHNGLRIHGSIPDGKGGRKRITDSQGKEGRPETRPGAFVIYKQLKGELT